MGLRGPKPRSGGYLWSNNFAYGIGLMTADGNLSSDGRHLVFVTTDKELAVYVKEIFEVRANIIHKYAQKEKKLGLHYRLQWGDVTLYNFLVRIGLTPNKSLTIGELLIPDAFFIDFLRGSFDGDGCFYSYFDPRWKSSFMFYTTFSSGSPHHIDWLQRSIFCFIGIRGHLTKGKKGNGIHQLKYAKKESLILLSHLYTSKSAHHLSRKKLKIEKALRIVGESL